MKVRIVGKNVKVTPGLTEKITKKLNVLTKYYLIDENDVASVLVREYPHRKKIEVTIPTKYSTLRTEVQAETLNEAIDASIDKLEDQIRRTKTRLQRRNKMSLGKAFVDLDMIDDGEEEPDEVVKTKSIVPTEISLDEAIMNMELIGHDFYIYTDDETHKIAVVYKRNDGGYGLIETE
ncbi:ribosome hibernation-promoting factor, HPF/YfiA family [Catenisphaera adipataccumulans]|jgi:putative sigma-54 modulation protein|uniref:Ribosome hibernation promoting factor n=1 Tax=Catenisphaera adipataccumulans TaxID=700500 RepID=A0A7W8FWG5_9FIRM|nr:ribosome-associated translation inhibitor RaiA [Catenisphaera adipataccumulans]MBB5183236.1 putative sigma-54 modulation protein [Catenisphaera adipataccumulans]